PGRGLVRRGLRRRGRGRGRRGSKGEGIAMSFSLAPFTVAAQEEGFTLAKVLRSRLGGPSWNDVRKLISARRVKVGDAICSDEARRLKENEVVVLLEHPKPLPRAAHPER